MTDKQSTDRAQNYSAVTFFDIEKSLRQSYPTWLLTPQGSIVAANFLALWLWDAAGPDDVLGVNAFDILSRNLGRIPIESNHRFFKNKTAMVKQLSETFGSGSYTAFIDAMQRDSHLREIYGDQQKLSGSAWGSNGQLQYSLQITYGHSSRMLLKFQVTLSSLYGKLGYLATCLPGDGCRDTETLVQEVNRTRGYSRESCYLASSSRESRTGVLLILLHLLHTEPEAEKSLQGQLLWGLALIKVIEEGLTHDEKDTSWEPLTAFQRISNALKSELELFAGDKQLHIVEDMRGTIDRLSRTSFLDKKHILALLYTFTMERKNALHLRDFLNDELRIEETAQEQLAIIEEPEEELPFDHVFQETFRQVMTVMLSTKEDAVALNCFRRAYEFRKGFSWLAESREALDVIGQNGLSYALRSALACYIVCSPEEAERKVLSAVVDETAEEELQCSDSEWTTRLLEAISLTIDEAFSLERFENDLLQEQVDITPKALDTIRLHIAAALVSYYERRKMGLSADPF